MNKGRQGTKRYSLYLVNPRFRYKHHAAQDELSHLAGKKKMSVPLALPLIAALTPEHYDIRIIDDEYERHPSKEIPDIVGITALVSTVDRAFEIADLYRERGAVVVIGGSYPTFAPEEVAEHADAVMVGEAELTWGRFLRDFEEGRIQKTYVQDCAVPFETSPIPRWDLVRCDEIMAVGVQATRGCPYNCEFCLVNKMFGRRMRFRDTDDVIREIESLPTKKIFFADDNLTIKKSYARELFGKLTPLGVSWFCQCSIDVARDDELLETMVAAGCISLLIGFESLSPEALQETNKKHNKVEEYEEAIGRIHAHGLNVLASFIVGFDADTLDTFDHILAFMERTRLVYGMLSILAAAPGTDLYNRMQDEGRLPPVRREFINGALPCMHYMNFSQTEVLERYFETLAAMYDSASLRRRAVPLFAGGEFANSGTATEVGPWEKLTTSVKLMGRFLFSRDKEKRLLFRELFGLVQEGKVSAESIVVFLLTVQATHDYLRRMGPALDDIRPAVAAMDKGPWRDRKR